MFELAPGLNPDGLGQMFASHGRLQVTEFLSRDSAVELHRQLVDSKEWRLTVNRGTEIFHFALDDVSNWDNRKRDLLDEAVSAGGRYAFQFRYEVIRVGDNPNGVLAEFERFMSSPKVVAVMRTIAGADDIAFADAHASRYQPGHFLTAHDDHLETMGRRAAYVLNLSPKWRPDWGGLLQFLDNRGDVVRAFLPRFNVLNLFRVPQLHNVSWVTPLAAAPRYAITGWLRADA